MARRIKPWRELSPSYRARLQRAGITAKDRRAGVDLRRARGHTPPPRPGQAPARFIAAGAPGGASPALPTPSDVTARRLWRETMAPGWLPNRQRMGDGTAAALSQLRNPRDWRSVHFTPAAAGQPWQMMVTYVRGHPQTILLPPDAYREVLDLLVMVLRTAGYVADEGAWQAFIDRGRDFDVGETT